MIEILYKSKPGNQHAEIVGTLRDGESFEPFHKEESHRTMDEDYIKRELDRQPITIEMYFGVQHMDWDKYEKDMRQYMKQLADCMRHNQPWQDRCKQWIADRLESVAEWLLAKSGSDIADWIIIIILSVLCVVEIVREFP